MYNLWRLVALFIVLLQNQFGRNLYPFCVETNLAKIVPVEKSDKYQVWIGVA